MLILGKKLAFVNICPVKKFGSAYMVEIKESILKKSSKMAPF